VCNFIGLLVVNSYSGPNCQLALFGMYKYNQRSIIAIFPSPPRFDAVAPDDSVRVILLAENYMYYDGVMTGYPM